MILPKVKYLSHELPRLNLEVRSAVHIIESHDGVRIMKTPCREILLLQRHSLMEYAVPDYIPKGTRRFRVNAKIN